VDGSPRKQPTPAGFALLSALVGVAVPCKLQGLSLFAPAPAGCLACPPGCPASGLRPGHWWLATVQHAQLRSSAGPESKSKQPTLPWCASLP
jgi:hypothetical protein